MNKISDSGFGSEVAKSTNFDSPIEHKSILDIGGDGDGLLVSQKSTLGTVSHLTELQTEEPPANEPCCEPTTNEFHLNSPKNTQASDISKITPPPDTSEVELLVDDSDATISQDVFDASTTNKDVSLRDYSLSKYCAKPYDTIYPSFGSFPLTDIFSSLESVPTTVKDTTEALPTYRFTPLPVLIHQSLNPPLLAQIRLVNRATLDYFMEDLCLLDHFLALRNYFFFHDGEFGHVLSKLLFEKVSLEVSPVISPFDLMGILDSALSSSVSVLSETQPFSSTLSFTAEDLPTKGFASTKFLHLKYKTPWPINLVITEANLDDYDRIFGLLLQVKQALWVLNDTWYQLKKSDRKLKGVSGCLEFRKIQLFRHEMLHFVGTIQSHLCCQLLQISWTEFENKLANNVHNLEELRNVHQTYLRAALNRCILSPEHEPHLKLVTRSFEKILKFRNVVLNFPWRQNEPQNANEFSKVVVSYLDFKNTAKLLYNALKASLRIRKEQYVLDFLVRFDFNYFYDYQTKCGQRASDLRALLSEYTS